MYERGDWGLAGRGGGPSFDSVVPQDGLEGSPNDGPPYPLRLSHGAGRTLDASSLARYHDGSGRRAEEQGSEGSEGGQPRNGGMCSVGVLRTTLGIGVRG